MTAKEDQHGAATELVHAKISPIHGQGLFARSEIPAGRQIIEYLGQRISKRQSQERCQTNNDYIFALDDETDLDGNSELNLARLINHSCEPNGEAVFTEGRIWIVARRTIYSGQEITFNYGYDLECHREHPCRCAAESCVGFIVAEEFFALLRRRAAETALSLTADSSRTDRRPS
jgi:SET domain-containing protein